MIEPGKNGRRSGSVAKGRCEAGCFAKNGRPLVRWILVRFTVRSASPEDAPGASRAYRLKRRAGALARRIGHPVGGSPTVLCRTGEG